MRCVIWDYRTYQQLHVLCYVSKIVRRNKNCLCDSNQSFYLFLFTFCSKSAYATAILRQSKYADGVILLKKQCVVENLYLWIKSYIEKRYTHKIMCVQ